MLVSRPVHNQERARAQLNYPRAYPSERRALPRRRNRLRLPEPQTGFGSGFRPQVEVRDLGDRRDDHRGRRHLDDVMHRILLDVQSLYGSSGE